jgi:hypothetical protein
VVLLSSSFIIRTEGSPWNRVLHEKQSLSQSGNSSTFMEAQVSLPCSQQRALWSQPKPDKSSTHPATLLLYDHSQYSYSCLWEYFPGGVYPSDCPTKFLYAFFIFPMRVTCPVWSILLYLITLMTFKVTHVPPSSNTRMWVQNPLQA